MPDIRVRQPDGWTTVTFSDDVETISLVGGQLKSNHLAFTLIGEHPDQPNQIESQLLDVDPADESKLSTPVPRTPDGTSIPIAALRRD